MPDIEALTQSIGRELFNLIQKQKKSVLSSSWWLEKALARFMRDDAFRQEALRFVDVFPALKTAEEKIEHFLDYFINGLEKPPLIFRAAGVLKHIPLGSKVLAGAAELAVRKTARHFIAGEKPEDAIRIIKQLQKNGAGFTLNNLGEATLSEFEAEQYTANYLYLMDILSPLPDSNFSIKYSSLYSQLDPTDLAGSQVRVAERYRRLLRQAKASGAFINVDSEPYYYLDLAQAIFMDTLLEDEFRSFQDAGFVVQAYLRDSGQRLRNIINWAEKRNCPVRIRLVKGAYWDTEVILARQKRWPIPVYTQKWQTDLNYERLTDVLLESYPAVRTAVASHNIRSVAHALARAQIIGLPADALEIQVLWGMGNPLMEALLDMGYKVRVYLTIGDLLGGMAYLARRIAENTSQTGFLFQSFGRGLSADDVVKNPAENIGRK